MSNKLSQLKEVIQKANPEIMELKFGCELEEDFIFAWSNGPLTWIISDKGKGTLIQVPNISNYKILGRPIRLADVLLALDKNGISASVDTHGNMGFLPFKGHTEWDLIADLDHQSEETINFLWELLCHL